MKFKSGDRVIFGHNMNIEWAEIYSISVISGCYDITLKVKDKPKYKTYNIPEDMIKIDTQHYREKSLKKIIG